MIDTKKDLEIQKLKIEIDLLKQVWWKKPSYLVVFIPSILTLFTFLVGTTTGYINLKKANNPSNYNNANTIHVSNNSILSRIEYQIGHHQNKIDSLMLCKNALMNISNLNNYLRKLKNSIFSLKYNIAQERIENFDLYQPTEFDRNSYIQFIKKQKKEIHTIKQSLSYIEEIIQELGIESINNSFRKLKLAIDYLLDQNECKDNTDNKKKWETSYIIDQIEKFELIVHKCLL